MEKLIHWTELKCKRPKGLFLRYQSWLFWLILKLYILVFEIKRELLEPAIPQSVNRENIWLSHHGNLELDSLKFCDHTLIVNLLVTTIFYHYEDGWFNFPALARHDHLFYSFNSVVEKRVKSTFGKKLRKTCYHHRLGTVR